MKSTIYAISIILIIIWGIGFFVYSLGAIIHLLLVIGLVSVIIMMVKRDRKSQIDQYDSTDSAPPPRPE